MNKRVLAALCILTTLHSYLVFANDVAVPPFFAKVNGVTARNSLVVTPQGGKPTQVVLAYLSIPIDEQPHAARSHQVLRAQLLNRTVSIRAVGEPKGDYILGVVYVGKDNFNLDFLKRGHAWVDYYQMTHPAWMAAQQRARESQRGLYADPHAMHPLDWQTEAVKAVSIVDMTNNIREDAEFKEYMMSTYVGNRKQKIYVPISCIDTWGNWPQISLVALMTVAGAEDSGYRLQSCT